MIGIPQAVLRDLGNLLLRRQVWGPLLILVGAYGLFGLGVRVEITEPGLFDYARIAISVILVIAGITMIFLQFKSDVDTARADSVSQDSRIFSELSDAGISSIYRDREDSDKSDNAQSWLEKAFRQFRCGEILMMGVSLRVFFHEASPFYHHICEMLDKNQNAKIKVLVCDPNCPAYSSRTKTERNDPSNAIRDIDQTIASISKLNDRFPAKIYHRIYTEAPYCTTVIFPDKCYFSPNILSPIAPVGLPVIIFKQGSSAYDRLTESFNHIWHRNGTQFSQRYSIK